MTDTGTHDIDYEAIKQVQQRIWSAGDFAMVATTSVIVAEEGLVGQVMQTMSRHLPRRPGWRRRCSGVPRIGSASCSARESRSSTLERFNRAGDAALVAPGEYLEVVASHA